MYLLRVNANSFEVSCACKYHGISVERAARPPRDVFFTASTCNTAPGLNGTVQADESWNLRVRLCFLALVGSARAHGCAGPVNTAQSFRSDRGITKVATRRPRCQHCVHDWSNRQIDQAPRPVSDERGVLDCSLSSCCSISFLNIYECTFAALHVQKTEITDSYVVLGFVIILWVCLSTKPHTIPS